MKPSPKECCCCGRDAGKFIQHFNRDNGFGLCEGCIDFCARNETRENFESCYGKPGIHYARAPSPGVLRDDLATTQNAATKEAH